MRNKLLYEKLKKLAVTLGPFYRSFRTTLHTVQKRATR